MEKPAGRSLRTHILFFAFIASILIGGILIFVALQPSTEEPPPRPGYMEFYDYGVAHSRPGLWGEALPAFSWAVRIDPRQTMGHYYHSLSALNAGFPRRALESINVVLEQPEHRRRAQASPTFYKLYEMRGHIYSNLGEYDKSRQDFLRAIELHPGEAEFWHYLCWTHLELGEFEEALQAGLKARELGYRTYESAFKLGMACRNLNRLEEAEMYLRECLTLNRGYTAGYKNLAEVLRKLKRVDEAAEMAEVFQTLARVDDELRKLSQRLLTAEHLTDEVFQRDMDLYATQCFQFSKFPELADAMGQLLARDPNNPAYHFKMAYARFELREEEAAEEHYRHCLVLLEMKRRQRQALSPEELDMEVAAMNSLSNLLIVARNPKLNRPSEAVLWAERARLRGYPHVEYLARALFAEGRGKEGLEMVREAMETLAENSPMRDVYEGLRDQIRNSLAEKDIRPPGGGESP